MSSRSRQKRAARGEAISVAARAAEVAFEIEVAKLRHGSVGGLTLAAEPISPRFSIARRRWAYCGLALILSALACAVAVLSLGAR